MPSIRDVSQRDACFPDVITDLLHLARVLVVVAVILVLD
jgi:hypothetical protein